MSREFRYVDWYAPNVGLVKNEYSSRDEVFTRMELVSFDDLPPSVPAAPGVRLASSGSRERSLPMVASLFPSRHVTDLSDPRL